MPRMSCRRVIHLKITVDRSKCLSDRKKFFCLFSLGCFLFMFHKRKLRLKNPRSDNWIYKQANLNFMSQGETPHASFQNAFISRRDSYWEFLRLTVKQLIQQNKSCVSVVNNKKCFGQKSLQPKSTCEQRKQSLWP